MLNKLLFLLLTRIFRVNKHFLNPVNWRVTHPSEPIAKAIGYNPLIFTGFVGQAQYGFENIVFLANGRIYLAPNKIEKNKEAEKENSVPPLGFDVVTVSLLKYYMEINPHILVKKFPCKILRYLMQRQIPKIKTIITQMNEKLNVSPTDNISDVIKDDLNRNAYDAFAIATKAKDKRNLL